MITENEIKKDLLPLLKGTFLGDYIQYAEKQTTSPLVYHIGVGLGLLSCTVPTPLKMRYAGDMHVSFYALLAGRSGEDQKSTAIGIGREILWDADHTLIGNTPASSEGMIDQLAKKNRQMLVYKEMGKLLSGASGGYMESLKTLFTDLWDCEDQVRAKANDEVIIAQDPRLTILGACSIPYLEKYTQPHDWTGGFLGRWTVFYGKRERTDPDPKGTTEGKQDLINLLSDLSNCGQTGKTNSEFPLTPTAFDRWVEWFYHIERMELPNLISGLRSRAPTMARKIAMILAWDLGYAARDGWQIDLRTLEPALLIADYHLRSCIALNGDIAEHDDAQMKRIIMRMFESVGMRIQYAKILRDTKYTHKTLEPHIESLVLSQVLKKVDIGDVRNPIYERLL